MSTPTVSARIFKICVGLFLMLSGLAGTTLLFIPYRRAMETRSWTETPCEITESRVDEYRISELAEPVARVFLKYTYSFNGMHYTGTHWKRSSYAFNEGQDFTMRTPHPQDAADLVKKYPVSGEKINCWVNPSDPGEAVLEHQTKGAIYTLWWPMLFAVGGGGIVWSAFRPGRGRPSRTPA
jgi:hypothetical protein